MKMGLFTKILTGTLLFMLLVSAASAQTLKGKTRIELKGGLWNQNNDITTTVGGGVVESNYDGEGGLGALIIGHYVREDLALIMSISGIGVNVNNRVSAGVVYDHTVAVAPILFGARYYFPTSTNGGKWRPYVTASLGPVIGVEDKEEVRFDEVVTTSTTETALGGHLGAGLDITLSRLFMLGISGGYYAQTDFDNPVGGKKEYNGPEFGLSFSVMF